jgi:hypothetical protein
MTIRRYSVAMTAEVDDRLCSHLLQHYEAGKRQEDLCFALWSPSTGLTRLTGILRDVILPEADDRKLQGNVSFEPQYFHRAIGIALEAGCGLAFLHSHPYPGWQDMSRDDVNAEYMMASRVLAATGLPLLGMTQGTDGAWSARFWHRAGPNQYSRDWCESVRVIGDQFRITYKDDLRPVTIRPGKLRRTISAWGEEMQGILARIHCGLVGVGSVGDILVEGLARTGIQEVTTIDYDKVELHNLDRLLHAVEADATESRLKVDVLQAVLPSHATADDFQIHTVPYAVYEEEGFKAALDCDVLFGCVDRPWGRSVLNHIAYAHLIPVIDGGISVRTTPSGRIRSADWKAHRVHPGRQCLECLQQYHPSFVTLERDGYLDDPKYIDGLPNNHPIKMNENVFAFSLSTAAAQLLQFLSMVVAPGGISDPGYQTYHFTTGTMDRVEEASCGPNCLFPGITAKGDQSGVTVTGNRPTRRSSSAPS